MLKVLIADDEKKVCRLIVNLVDWEQLGFEIVGIVNDGISAYKFIQETPVDVMITDIRMPGYDGMELIQKAKVLYPDMHIVIISGYSQFDYAQNAIRYGRSIWSHFWKPVSGRSQRYRPESDAKTIGSGKNGAQESGGDPRTW